MIEFDADLVVSTGDLCATVRGEGSRLRVRTDDPRAFLTEVRAQGGSDVTGLARVSDLLAREGVSVTLSGPDGDVASVGAEARSRLGSLATGSRHVEAHDYRALVPIVVGGLRDRLLAGPLRLAALLAIGWWIWSGVRARDR